MPFFSLNKLPKEQDHKLLQKQLKLQLWFVSSIQKEKYRNCKQEQVSVQ